MSSGRATIIFDFDGTLANTVDLIVKIYNDHAQEYAYLPIHKKEFPALRKAGYRKAMRQKKIKRRALPRIMLRFRTEMKQQMDGVEPYDGITDMLKRLKRKGFSIGILTSNDTAIVNDFLKVHEFPSFDFVVSEKTLFGKERALKKILRRYDLAQNQVLYIGDEPRDVVASHKAGVQAIGVTWGLGGKEGFEKAIPDVIVDTPKELEQTILELAGY